MSDSGASRIETRSVVPVVVRFVELHFPADAVEEARRQLTAQAPLVRQSEGCQRLEIIESTDQVGMFITYSYWRDADDLNRYRRSEVFKGFWGRVKPLFSQPARAYSFRHLVSPV